MKRSKYSEAQIAFVLKQVEDTTIGEVCRKTGISEATSYAWRKKYAGLMPSEMRRLRQMEEGMREIAEMRVRYGYRRIHVLLRQEG